MSTDTQIFSSFINDFSEALDALRKVQIGALQQYTQVQLDFMNLCLECQCAQIRGLARTEKPTDILAAESDVATEYMNRFFSNGQQMFEVLCRLQDEMLNLMRHHGGVVDKPVVATGKSVPAKKTAVA